MKEISRSDLHHNFLKNIIVRLDFQGVLESEMDKVLEKIKIFAKNHDFLRYEEKNVNQIDVLFNDKMMQDSFETTNKVYKQKVYSFINENRGIVLDVSNSFICLIINTTCYIPFDEYREFITSISEIYDENIDFFTVKRFGLRKINECLITEKDKIKDYFSSSQFSYFDSIDGTNNIQSNHTNIFTINNYHVNLISNIVQGTQNSQNVYSVRIDIDVYLDNVDCIKKLLSDVNEITNINDLIFKIYIFSLTDSLIEKLSCESDFDDTTIIGVEPND